MLVKLFNELHTTFNLVCVFCVVFFLVWPTVFNMVGRKINAKSLYLVFVILFGLSFYNPLFFLCLFASFIVLIPKLCSRWDCKLFGYSIYFSLLYSCFLYFNGLGVYHSFASWLPFALLIAIAFSIIYQKNGNNKQSFCNSQYRLVNSVGDFLLRNVLIILVVIFAAFDLNISVLHKIQVCVFCVFIFFLANKGMRFLSDRKNAELDKNLDNLYRFLIVLLNFFDIFATLGILYIYGVKVSFLFSIIDYGYINKIFYIFILYIILRFWFLLSYWFLISTINHYLKKSPRKCALLVSACNILLSAIFFGLFIILIAGCLFDVQIGAIFQNIGLLTAGVILALNSLVKDLILGIIMMFEDLFSIGDDVTVGSISGVVEEITPRLLKIRNSYGELVAIPFNRAEIIVNSSRDYAIIIIELPIQLNNNIDLVCESLNEAAVSIMKNSSFKHAIIGDIKIYGPLNISLSCKSHMLFTCNIKVNPTESIKAIKSESYKIFVSKLQTNKITCY